MERVRQEKWPGLIQNLLDTQAQPGPSGHLCPTTALSWGHSCGLDALPDLLRQTAPAAQACADPRWPGPQAAQSHCTRPPRSLSSRSGSHPASAESFSPCNALPTPPLAPGLLILGDSAAPCMKPSEMAEAPSDLVCLLHSTWAGLALPCVGPATGQSWGKACSPKGPASGCSGTPHSTKSLRTGSDRSCWGPSLTLLAASRQPSMAVHESLFPSSGPGCRWLWVQCCADAGACCPGHSASDPGQMPGGMCRILPTRQPPTWSRASWTQCCILSTERTTALTEIATPGGKQQPPTARLLASDAQACLGCERWVVSGQGFAIWLLSRGWECHRPMSQRLLLSALSAHRGALGPPCAPCSTLLQRAWKQGPAGQARSRLAKGEFHRGGSL